VYEYQIFHKAYEMRNVLCTAVMIFLFSPAIAVPVPALDTNKPGTRYPVKEEHGADLYMLNYSKYINYGFYLSVIGQAAQYRKGWGALIGGRAALLVDNIFAIGAGYELSIATSRSRLDGSGGADDRLYASSGIHGDGVNIAYGGGYICYHIFSDKIVNFSLGALGGGGHLGREYAGGPGGTFYIIEPEIYLYVNLPKYARIGIGASYRISWGVRYQGLSDRDFRGFSIGLQVQGGIL
jgi:hypothetical protein